MTDVSGVPEMVGARLAGATTWMVNEASDTRRGAVAHRNRDAIADVPTFAVVGVPDRRPVVVLNDAQLG